MGPTMKGSSEKAVAKILDDDEIEAMIAAAELEDEADEDEETDHAGEQ